MDVKKAIESGRSIRAYKNLPVDSKIIMELIDAARLAPSGCNSQPWRFKIVDDTFTKEKLKKNNVFLQSFVYTAPILIFCCADPNAYPKSKFVKGIDDSYEFRALRDLSIACQNLVLRATELGLGTCYIGWMNKTKAKKILNIPKRFVLPYAIALGYPLKMVRARPRKKIKDILF
jgi:nitroreductase